jgi:hypothetical protein
MQELEESEFDKEEEESGRSRKRKRLTKAGSDFVLFMDHQVESVAQNSDIGENQSPSPCRKQRPISEHYFTNLDTLTRH